MITLLVIIGCFFALAGLVGAMANEIAGIGLVGLACFCLLLARLAQASAYYMHPTASPKSTTVPEPVADHKNQAAV